LPFDVSRYCSTSTSTSSARAAATAHTMLDLSLWRGAAFVAAVWPCRGHARISARSGSRIASSQVGLTELEQPRRLPRRWPRRTDQATPCSEAVPGHTPPWRCSRHCEPNSLEVVRQGYRIAFRGRTFLSFQQGCPNPELQASRGNHRNLGAPLLR
jgi:hypothetical protein